MFDISVDERLTYATEPPFKKILHIGCGWVRFTDCVNADKKPGTGIDRVFDITEKWDAVDGEFDMVLAFHILEHIPIDKVLDALKEAHRVLRRGGVLLIEVPDIKGCFEEYLKGNVGILEGIYGCDRYSGDQHRWGYTGSDLVALLHAAGFDRTVVKPGLCYHKIQLPTIRVEAVTYSGKGNWADGRVGNA